MARRVSRSSPRDYFRSRSRQQGLFEQQSNSPGQEKAHLALLKQPAPEARAACSDALWAAWHLPQLALEVMDVDDDAPWVVVTEQRAQLSVYAASTGARAAGVEIGMALTAAYVLSPELQTRERDEGAEQTALVALADWAGQYSSIVSLDTGAVLLEVGGSLRLFGGLAMLRAQMQQALAGRSYEVQMALAPTPQAALLLARCGQHIAVTEMDGVRSTLGKLPVLALPLDQRQQMLCMRLGLKRVRDLLRLPLAGVRRRFGNEFFDYLERLLGERPEPRQSHVSAPYFCQRWVFPLPTDKAQFILHAVERLLPQLVSFMRGRALVLLELELVGYHQRRAASYLSLSMREPSCDGDYLMQLLEERLRQQPFTDELLELELRAERFQPQALAGGDLFKTEGGELPAGFFDRLQTRLGADAVCGVEVVADHRPENAWRECAPQSAAPSSLKPGTQARPMWLLPQPKPLLQGLMGIELQSGPERIEGGWWDGEDVRRDYYRGHHRDGRRMWLFRDCVSGGWYLHGLFA